MTTDAKVTSKLRHLWASPAYFITAAFFAFNVFGSTRVGWVLFAAAFSGPILALGWQAVRRERPDSFVIVPVAALLLFALLFTLAEGAPWA